MEAVDTPGGLGFQQIGRLQQLLEFARDTAPVGAPGHDLAESRGPTGVIGDQAVEGALLALGGRGGKPGLGSPHRDGHCGVLGNGLVGPELFQRALVGSAVHEDRPPQGSSAYHDVYEGRGGENLGRGRAPVVAKALGLFQRALLGAESHEGAVQVPVGRVALQHLLYRLPGIGRFLIHSAPLSLLSLPTGPS